VATNRILVATTHDGGENRHKVEPSEERDAHGARRNVFIQSGRWIFI
jgi:hypothetical protein